MKETSNTEKLYAIIKKPLITEKSVGATSLGQYTFEVTKDATKVDRSAAYIARHIAKNIVANGYADKCEIQLSYAIGIEEPLSIYVNTFGTNKIEEEKIINKIKEKFDLTPNGIIKYLDLQKPIFAKTTNYGHLGKDYLPWEKIIKM